MSAFLFMLGLHSRPPVSGEMPWLQSCCGNARAKPKECRVWWENEIPSL